MRVDRIARLRELAVDSLKSYRGRFAAVERIGRDLKSIIASLEDPNGVVLPLAERTDSDYRLNQHHPEL